MAEYHLFPCSNARTAGGPPAVLTYLAKNVETNAYNIVVRLSQSPNFLVCKPHNARVALVHKLVWQVQLENGNWFACEHYITDNIQSINISKCTIKESIELTEQLIGVLGFELKNATVQANFPFSPLPHVEVKAEAETEVKVEEEAKTKEETSAPATPPQTLGGMVYAHLDTCTPIWTRSDEERAITASFTSILTGKKKVIRMYGREVKKPSPGSPVLNIEPNRARGFLLYESNDRKVELVTTEIDLIGYTLYLSMDAIPEVPQRCPAPGNLPQDLLYPENVSMKDDGTITMVARTYPQNCTRVIYGRVLHTELDEIKVPLLARLMTSPIRKRNFVDGIFTLQSWFYHAHRFYPVELFDGQKAFEKHTGRAL